MPAVRHARNLAAIAGAAGALLMLMSPARAHAGVDPNSGISNVAPVASDLSLKPHGHDGGWKRHHPGDPQGVPEPGTFGLYFSALLGGALFVRTRKSRNR